MGRGFNAAGRKGSAISFVVRYEHLPDDVKVHIGPVGTEWHIKNLWELRHTLNDFRPIIQNQNDSTSYTNVHATIQKRLRRKDPGEGLILQVYEGDSDLDVTADYAKFLAETTKAITAILEALEFRYLYNDILQHSIASYSKRFLNDYTTGEFNYILWKHVAVLGQVRLLAHALLSYLERLGLSVPRFAYHEDNRMRPTGPRLTTRSSRRATRQGNAVVV